MAREEKKNDAHHCPKRRIWTIRAVVYVEKALESFARPKRESRKQVR